MLGMKNNVKMYFEMSVSTSDHIHLFQLPQVCVYDLTSRFSTGQAGNLNYSWSF